jgi:hypothetical protein
VFEEILVIDYISSYASLTEDQRDQLKRKVIDPGFITNCPNGTIIGHFISKERLPQAQVFYPFFSHMRVPIKAGERAWVFVNHTERVSYWLSRKVQNGYAEDLNFTHDDRAFFAKSVTSDTNTKLFLDADTSGLDLESTRKNAISRPQFTGHVVVGVASKSPDFLIQGSNSTAIQLTDDSGIGKILIKSGLKDDIAASFSAVQNTDGYKEALKPNTNPPTAQADTSIIEVSAGFGVVITVGGASIRVQPNGDVVITPAPDGVIKLGGDDADKAILCQEAIRTGGNIVAPSIVSTAGGILGAPNYPATGQFASKILVK